MPSGVRLSMKSITDTSEGAGGVWTLLFEAGFTTLVCAICGRGVAAAALCC